jgi:hypothetical protein
MTEGNVDVKVREAEEIPQRRLLDFSNRRVSVHHSGRRMGLGYSKTKIGDFSSSSGRRLWAVI